MLHPRHPKHALRLALAILVLLMTALPVRPEGVGPLEEDLFRSVNELTGALYGPIWVVMQMGTMIAVAAVAAVAAVLRRVRLALDVFVAGTAAWFLARLLKDYFNRGRPGTLLEEVIIRGDPADGLGYVSGHTGVAFALATVASHYFGARARAVMWTAAVVVGLARIYVGVHLPLDVVGGAAMGWAIGSLVHLALGAPRHEDGDP
jgi:membrane-associated phospholipid phosphatase